MPILENVIVGVAVGVPATALGWFGYRRSKQADDVAEEQGTIAQIISGLNALNANLRSDNDELRARFVQMEDCIRERAELRTKIVGLEAQLAIERLRS